MDEQKLTKEQVEDFRAELHRVEPHTWLDPSDIDALCDLALSALTPARDEALEEAKPYYLKVGKYAIGNHPAGGYWIEHEDGEGMQGGAHFEEVIDEYFKRNF